MKFRKKSEVIPVAMDMTPMIDMVFQLLIFFMLTFKILSQEGDFGISMPLGAASAAQSIEVIVPPIVVKLRANPTGELAGITINDKQFANFASVHTYLQSLVGTERGPGSIQESAEVELHTDYNLHYRHVVDALTAVTGYVGDDGSVIKLIEKIKFAPPKAAAG